MDKLSFVRTTAIIEKQSTFMGHAIHVKNSSELKLAYAKMRYLYSECDT